MLIINNVSKFKLNLLRDMSVWFYSSFVCTSAYANIYSKTIREINIRRSEVHCESPFEPGGSGLSFLLHTTCVRSCCTWRASCVVAFIKRIQRYKKTTHTQNTKQDKTKQKNTEAWDGGRISVLRPNPRSRKNVVKVSKWSRSCAEEAHRRLEAGDEATGGGCAGSRTTRPRESASFQVRGDKIPCVAAGNVDTHTVPSPAQGKASGGQVFAARHFILCSIDNHPPSRACCSTHQSLQARHETLGQIRQHILPVGSRACREQ